LTIQQKKKGRATDFFLFVNGFSRLIGGDYDNVNAKNKAPVVVGYQPTGRGWWGVSAA
jgi:hypothetical protein